MPDPALVTRHYSQTTLLDAVRAGIAKLGKTPGTVTVDDLAPVDEFHTGGRVATERFLNLLGLAKGERVLDIGCGVGGASRYAAHRFGCSVSGIDLTPAYIAAGRELTGWVGLSDRVVLEEGNATDIPFGEGSFDKAFMLHVGMNIADKEALAKEMFRVLRPGGRVGIYDVMQTAAGALDFPVPWANSPETSAVAPPETYKQALADAGFRLLHEESRAEFATDFFDQQRAQMAEAGGPPPLGLHLLMGSDRPVKIANMADNIKAGRIAPIELIAEKPA